MDYRKIIVTINLWRIIPYYFICMHSKHKEKAKKDLNMWKFKHNNLRSVSDLNAFAWLVMNKKEFRNVMFNRLHRNKILYIISRILFKPLGSLYISMPPEKIGGGCIFNNSCGKIYRRELLH